MGTADHRLLGDGQYPFLGVSRFALRFPRLSFGPRARWLATRPRVGLRMDFDCDILVQLYWDGIRVVNLPVRVFYPPDGISHFHAIENLYLSKMHARNFFGMLARLPKLLGRHFHA